VGRPSLTRDGAKNTHVRGVVVVGSAFGELMLRLAPLVTAATPVLLVLILVTSFAYDIQWGRNDVTPVIRMIRLGGVSCYLVAAFDGLVLIDSGIPKEMALALAPLTAQELRRLGGSIRELQDAAESFKPPPVPQMERWRSP